MTQGLHLHIHSHSFTVETLPACPKVPVLGVVLFPGLSLSLDYDLLEGKSLCDFFNFRTKLRVWHKAGIFQKRQIRNG